MKDGLKALLADQMARMDVIGDRLEAIDAEVETADEPRRAVLDAEVDQLMAELRGLDAQIWQIDLGMSGKRGAA